MTIEKREAIRLSDGRELIYFDEAPDADRGQVARPARAAASAAHLPAAARPAGRRVGRGGRAPADQDVPAAHRQMPAVPVHTGLLHRDPGAGLRRGGLREPVPVVQRPDQARRDRRGHRAGAGPPGVGRCEVVCFTSDHNSSFGALPPARVRTVHRRAGRPDHRDEFADRRGPGLPVRESRHRDRRDTEPPARPDLRLPDGSAADAGHAGRGRETRGPDRRAQPLCGRAGRGAAEPGYASSRPTSTGRRTCRPPPAGPSRSSWPRTAR